MRTSAAAVLILFSMLPAFAAELTGLFRHPSGLAIAHPADWTGRTEGEFVVLGPTSGAPLPRMICFAREAEGVTSAADPQVGPYLLALLREELPSTQPVGKPEPFATPLGEAVIYRFEANGQHHRAYVVMVGGEALVLDFVRPVNDAAGDRLADAMLATLGRIEVPGTRDQLLVGVWRKTTRAQTGSRGGTFSGEDTLILVFEADGTVRRTTQSRFGGSLDGLAVIASARHDSGWTAGTWTSGRQTLSIAWADGTREEFSASVYRNSYTQEMNLRLTWQGRRQPLILHRIGG
jgi:hypothetical protein